MVLLTGLPSELLHHVFSYVHPKDLGTLLRTCKYLHVFVAGNKPLHRAIYYRELDPPPTDQLDWEKELHDLVRLEFVCSQHRPTLQKRADLPFVLETVTRLLRHARSAPVDINDVSEYTTWFEPEDGALRRDRVAMYGRSCNATLLAGLLDSDANRDAFLSQSALFERAQGQRLNKPFDAPPRPESQMSAKLNCLFGLPLDPSGDWCGEEDRIHYRHHRCRHHHHHHLHHNLHRDGQTTDEARRVRLSLMYPFACSKVYDLRQHTRATRWGPFMADGSDRVDWEKVEAVLFVLRRNMVSRMLDDSALFSVLWNEPFAGTWPNSYRPSPCTAPLPFSVHAGPSRRPRPRSSDAGLSSSHSNATDGDSDVPGGDAACRDDDSDDDGHEQARKMSPSWSAATTVAPILAPYPEQADNAAGAEGRGGDPYGVSGLWLRVLSFLDHGDFFKYNFPDGGDRLPPNVPRPALDVREALRIVVARLRVTRVEWPESGSGGGGGGGGGENERGGIGPVAPGYPVVHYVGSTVGVHSEVEGLASGLKGFVYMTPEGEVRWTSISTIEGQERWRSEGVQLGGIRSARGVVGTWLPSHYGRYGPCGPMAYWRIGGYEGPNPGEDEDEDEIEIEELARIARGIMVRAGKSF